MALALAARSVALAPWLSWLWLPGLAGACGSLFQEGRVETEEGVVADPEGRRAELAGGGDGGGGGGG